MPKYAVLAIVALVAALIAIAGILISIMKRQLLPLGSALGFAGAIIAFMTGIISLALYVVS